MTVFLLNGVIATTPTRLDDRVKVSVPDNKTPGRRTYDLLTFRPVPSAAGGIRLPQAGDSALLGVDDETGASWVVAWHRDDPTDPPYT